MHSIISPPISQRFLYQIYLNSIYAKRARTLCTQAPSSSDVASESEKLSRRELAKEKTKTVFLPKTNFEVHIKSVDRSQLDAELAHMGKFSELYDWQLKDPSRSGLPRFRLLDGPPYANGQPHVGHAINKVLKDFIVKSHIQLGYRILYQPGWDCHGLPIELKITKEAKTNPLEIRQDARHVASTSMMSQMSIFKKWGVTSDWPNPYLTMNADYVAKQLEIFGDLYEKGVIYRAYSPVYWSPSSKTALAESELEYNEKHESLATYFCYLITNLTIDNLSLSYLKSTSISLYALIWTTTPWTLPMNNAIAYSEKLKYAVIEFEEKTTSNRKLYVLAANLVLSLERTINKPIKVHTTFDSSVLNGVNYINAYNKKVQKFLPANFVASNIGTGLVHTAYAHGHDDYALALSQNELTECFVDENGRYMSQMGPQLEGKEVLGEGPKVILELLKENVVHSYKYVHSYPYDWRTKKPVIIRSSQQWFMNVSEIGKKCVELLKSEILAECAQVNAMIPLILNRPAWCISRQRVWGVPIPAMIRKSSNEALISTNLIKRIAELVRTANTSDIWWKSSPAEILTEKLMQEFNLIQSDLPSIEKSNDIMDVWMDSGLVWNLSKNESGEFEQADVVIEGLDQLRGWFMSMLLTSVAINGTSPYKKVLVHGFCVDEDNEKMSKSIGNVVDPDMITDGNLRQKALGADGLRLWVALYGSGAVNNIRIGKTVLNDIEIKITQIRNSLKYLLGVLDGYDLKEPKKVNVLDQYIIMEVEKFLKRCEQNYKEYRFNTVINLFMQFLQNPLSAYYFTFVKERLYCDSLKYESHIAARYTLALIGRTLVDSISTIMPHLATEFCSYHPATKNSPENFLRSFAEINLDLAKTREKFVLHEEDLEQIMDIVFEIREQINKIISKSNKKSVLRKVWTNRKNFIPFEGAIISGPTKVIEILRKIQPDDDSFYSELVELLGVSYVKFDSNITDDLHIELVHSPLLHCPRCRKNNRKEEEIVCRRCFDAESSIVC